MVSKPNLPTERSLLLSPESDSKWKILTMMRLLLIFEVKLSEVVSERIGHRS